MYRHSAHQRDIIRRRRIHKAEQRTATQRRQARARRRRGWFGPDRWGEPPSTWDKLKAFLRR